MIVIKKRVNYTCTITQIIIIFSKYITSNKIFFFNYLYINLAVNINMVHPEPSKLFSVPHCLFSLTKIKICYDSNIIYYANTI